MTSEQVRNRQATLRACIQSINYFDITTEASLINTIDRKIAELSDRRLRAAVRLGEHNKRLLACKDELATLKE